MKLKHILSAAALFVVTSVSAQNLTADDMILLSTNSTEMSYSGASVNVFVRANGAFNIESTVNWLTAEADASNPGLVLVRGNANTDNEPRTGVIKFTNAAGCVRNLTVTQRQDESVESAPTDTKLQVQSQSSTPANSYGSNSLNLAFDGNRQTFWHSGTRNTSYTITVNIKSGEGDADYFLYNTRTDGNGNGNWGEFELQVKCGNETEYRSLGTYNANYADRMIEFAEPLRDLRSYRIIIKPGQEGWISASEIGMYRKVDVSAVCGDIFADDMLLALKPGVTQAQIDAIPNDFYRVHAQRLLDGYDTAYRYATYECFKSVNVLSDEWRAPGKLYDQIPGVTGINFIPGKNAVIVRGIPEGQTVQLKVVAWWNGWEGGNFNGCNPITTTFTLHNGLNTIDYHCINDYGDWPGLAYIAYFADDVDYTQTIEQQKAAHPDIEVHFVNGQVNGYLSLDKTNEEMHQITANAKNRCMDLVGERVHQIWTAQGLHDYCRAADGTSLGYLQFMNAIDSLIVWEHRSMGFEKYNRIPRNRTMAYVNFTYYMFQGGFGVSFHRDQESRVLNCRKLIYHDQDLVWGLSHEWGHQHQMNPYYCWSGLGEVSNNIQSYFNIAMMGYNTSGTAREGNATISYDSAERPSVSEFNTAYKNLVERDDYKPGNISSCRRLAYDNRLTDGSVCNSVDYRNYISTLSDSAYKTKAQDAAHAVHINEMDITTTLIPKLKLMIYFFQNPTGPKGVSPDAPYIDITADWYEALRQNDYSTGSQIEKTSNERDKYELIAGAQNYNQNGALAELNRRFPESVWSTRNHDYLSNAVGNNSNSLPFIMNWCRKVSRLVGYNLYPYFEEWGYLRTVALRIGDYANRWYIATPEMIAEFKADMDALVASGEIDEMPRSMLDAITACPHWQNPKPRIPNTGRSQQ